MSLRDDLIAQGLLRPGAATSAPIGRKVTLDSTGPRLEAATDLARSDEAPDSSKTSQDGESVISDDDEPEVQERYPIPAPTATIPANSHFASIEQLRTTLLTLEPSDFVSRYVLEPVPFVFDGNMQAWIAWKTNLAKQLDVDPREIVLTGSGSVGFSLNPRKLLKAFGAESDLDVGVISRHYFDMAWWTLRRYNPLFGGASRARTKAFNQHRAGYIFDGSIATDQVLSLLPFGVEWQRALDYMGRIDPTSGRDVKLRIYRDFESLRGYQMGSVNSLRALLAQPEPDESPVTEEIEK